MRTRWEPGFRCGHLAPFVAEHPGQMVRSFRAAMVIRSLRIVAVGALRMRRLSSRTALARRNRCLNVAMTVGLSLSTVGRSGSACRFAGDAGRFSSVAGREIVTAGSACHDEHECHGARDRRRNAEWAHFTRARCVVEKWFGKRTRTPTPVAGRVSVHHSHSFGHRPPLVPATMRPRGNDDAPPR
jgi:hypothetical protein